MGWLFGMIEGDKRFEIKVSISLNEQEQARQMLLRQFPKARVDYAYPESKTQDTIFRTSSGARPTESDQKPTKEIYCFQGGSRRN